MYSDADLRRFASEPAVHFGHDREAMHTLDPAELADLQLAAVRLRLRELRERVPALAALADAHGVRDVDRLDDIAPLLYPTGTYASYPAEHVREGRFDRLTEWLDRLTAVDLSTVDASGCDSIDAWLDLLDRRTELRVAHSADCSGTMAFVPHTATQYERVHEVLRLDVLPPGDRTGVDVVWPGFARGRTGLGRHATALARHVAGTPDRFHALYPGALSADLVHLAGRLRAAEGGPVEVSPAPAARLEEFAALRDPSAVERFLGRLADTLRGVRVAVLGRWDAFNDLADAGPGNLFGAESVILPACGGTNGVPRERWEHRVARFAGVPALRPRYTAFEAVALNPRCHAHGYHLEPWIVPFLLDPHTGAALPRDGVRTGRAAFYDLTAEHHWGGFVTGDRVTVDRSPCGCGRSTPRVLAEIGRYDGGVGSTANAAALNDALDVLTGALV